MFPLQFDCGHAFFCLLHHENMCRFGWIDFPGSNKTTPLSQANQLGWLSGLSLNNRAAALGYSYETAHHNLETNSGDKFFHDGVYGIKVNTLTKRWWVCLGRGSCSLFLRTQQDRQVNRLLENKAIWAYNTQYDHIFLDFRSCFYSIARIWEFNRPAYYNWIIIDCNKKKTGTFWQ